MELNEATRLIKATQLMLLGKDNQPISDLYYALQIALDLIEESKWISVEDRLPDKNGNYLVLLNNGEMTTDIFDEEELFMGFWGYMTHWRPLPKPYESEDKQHE